MAGRREGDLPGDPAGADREGLGPGRLQAGFRRLIAMAQASTLMRDDAEVAGREPVRRRRGRRHRGEDLTKVLFVLPAALAMLALFGYPVVKNLVMSLQDYSLRTFFTGDAPWVGLKNYSTVVTDNLFSQ